jgi:hypothetical protein
MRSVILQQQINAPQVIWLLEKDNSQFSETYLPMCSFRSIHTVILVAWRCHWRRLTLQPSNYRTLRAIQVSLGCELETSCWIFFFSWVVQLTNLPLLKRWSHNLWKIIGRKKRNPKSEIAWDMVGINSLYWYPKQGKAQSGWSFVNTIQRLWFTSWWYTYSNYFRTDNKKAAPS